MLKDMFSFDDIQTADIYKKVTSYSSPYGPGYIVPGRHGNCLRCGNGQGIGLTYDAQGTWIIGFAFKTDDSGAITILSLRDVGDDQLVLDKRSDGTLAIYRGTHSLGILIASSTNALSTNTWYYIELKAMIANSGTLEVRVNGSSSGWIPSQVADTQATANATANHIAFASSGGDGNHYIDDVYIFDGTGTTRNDFNGDCRVAASLPNGNGTHSDWVGSDTDSVDNYLHVDEKATDFPDDDTSYVESDTVDAIDTYTFEDITFLPGETAIDGIKVSLCAKKTAAGEKTICPVVRIDGVDYDGTNANPSEANYTYIGQVYAQTPEESPRQWTPAILSAAEFGQKVVV